VGEIDEDAIDICDVNKIFNSSLRLLVKKPTNNQPLHTFLLSISRYKIHLIRSRPQERSRS
jgi:hypothetical protein